jgi:hypothetical protein
LRVLFPAWAAGFGETVFPEFVTLLLGAVSVTLLGALLVTGRRTVSRVVHVIGGLAELNPSSHRSPH